MVACFSTGGQYALGRKIILELSTDLVGTVGETIPERRTTSSATTRRPQPSIQEQRSARAIFDKFTEAYTPE